MRAKVEDSNREEVNKGKQQRENKQRGGDRDEGPKRVNWKRVN